MRTRPDYAPQLIDGLESAARSGFDQRGEVLVRRGNQSLSFLGVVVHDDRVGGRRSGEFEAVPHVSAVGTDLT